MKPRSVDLYANVPERAGARVDLAVVSQHELRAYFCRQPFVYLVQVARFFFLIFVDWRKKRSAAGVLTHRLQNELARKILNAIFFEKIASVEIAG